MLSIKNIFKEVVYMGTLFVVATPIGNLNDFSKFGFHFLIENSEKTKREWIRCLEECGVKVIMETSPV